MAHLCIIKDAEKDYPDGTVHFCMKTLGSHLKFLLIFMHLRLPTCVVLSSHLPSLSKLEYFDFFVLYEKVNY